MRRRRDAITPGAFCIIPGGDGLQVGHPGQLRPAIERPGFGADHHVQQRGQELRRGGNGSVQNLDLLDALCMQAVGASHRGTVGKLQPCGHDDLPSGQRPAWMPKVVPTPMQPSEPGSR